MAYARDKMASRRRQPNRGGGFEMTSETELDSEFGELSKENVKDRHETF